MDATRKSFKLEVEVVEAVFVFLLLSFKLTSFFILSLICHNPKGALTEIRTMGFMLGIFPAIIAIFIIYFVSTFSMFTCLDTPWNIRLV